MTDQRLEYCSACGEPTGNAGAGDGSIFWLDGAIGPLCPECNSVLRDEVLDDANGVGEPSDEDGLRQIQQELRPWVAHNFGDRPLWQPLLGVQEEAGELAHAYLKRAQGIRTNEDHDAAIRDAVADILIFLMDFCNAEGIDLQSEVTVTWERVKQRDWKADSARGTQQESIA